MDNPELVIADTMNLWIDTCREALGDLMQRVDGLVLNDEEKILGLEKVAAIGWSNGAMNLLLLALEKPETLAAGADQGIG